ncbi:hypothetical protein Micbo1qcDRAFT_215975 [Microdochium bolleyi]|uniref:Cyclase-domain-containing protein n=1 Tax=Microdochium bolleyi TaxID=196109 RepID=A0A136IRH9_9PEZI|nr:hypothetical protein Micbo1qcDRAFT_215975 [Microdochium bolleyi]
MDASKLPKWKDMPPVEGEKHGFAWGLFDKDGVRDELGTLNLLTPDTVLAAKDEIRTGKSVALNWGLDKLSQPTFGRSVLKHELVNWREKEAFPFWSWDDEISINTQTGNYYNGWHHDEVTKGPQLGIENWTKKGGIIGRGVLLDYVAYASRNSIAYSPMSDHAVGVKELDAMAADAGVVFRPGDILLVRMGWTKWYDEHGDEDRAKYVTNAYAWAGVRGCEETLEWLWDHHFAAVASDNNGFEVVPMDDAWRLHDFLLPGWGMPIGEMWDLEALAVECERQQRWTFFLTSSPLNLPGGVASPPNALAIF